MVLPTTPSKRNHLLLTKLATTGHGGNVGPAFKAFADFAAEQQQAREMEEEAAESSGGGGGGGDGSTARVKLISWYAGRESSTLAKELYGGEVGQHATPDEVCEQEISRKLQLLHWTHGARRFRLLRLPGVVQSPPLR